MVTELVLVVILVKMNKIVVKSIPLEHSPTFHPCLITILIVKKLYQPIFKRK